VEREGVELEKAKLIAKPVESLTSETPLLFNRCKLVIKDASSSITMVQKGQGKRLSLVDFKSD
jgi:hypothetical protein